VFRFWAKQIKDSKIIRDIQICDDSTDTRTHKVFRALDEVCNRFDLAKPIWLDSNLKEFKRTAKTRFRADSFVEEIPFDFLEIQIIEED